MSAEQVRPGLTRISDFQPTPLGAPLVANQVHKCPPYVLHGTQTLGSWIESLMVRSTDACMYVNGE